MALIIIDVQPGFKGSDKPTMIRAIQQEVRKSRSKNELIILLQYEDHGDTLPSITTLMEDYPYKEVVWKNSDDGAIEIIDRLFNINCKPKSFKICGLHNVFCVKSTVETLSTMRPRCEIILLKDCIKCVRKKVDLTWSDKLPNVKVKECLLTQ